MLKRSSWPRVAGSSRRRGRSGRSRSQPRSGPHGQAPPRAPRGARRRRRRSRQFAIELRRCEEAEAASRGRHIAWATPRDSASQLPSTPASPRAGTLLFSGVPGDVTDGRSPPSEPSPLQMTSPRQVQLPATSRSSPLLGTLIVRSANVAEFLEPGPLLSAHRGERRPGPRTFSDDDRARPRTGSAGVPQQKGSLRENRHTHSRTVPAACSRQQPSIARPAMT